MNISKYISLKKKSKQIEVLYKNYHQVFSSFLWPSKHFDRIILPRPDFVGSICNNVNLAVVEESSLSR